MTHDDERLSELLRAARALPRTVEPPPETWSGIQARIRPRRGARSFAPWYAAAAAIVLLVGGTVLVPAIGGRGNLPKAGKPADVAPPVASVAAVERRYASTLTELDAALKSQPGMAPATAKVVQQSLADIDTAIAETSDAIRTDPANPALVDILSSHYERKVDLLQRAAELSTSF